MKRIVEMLSRSGLVKNAANLWAVLGSQSVLHWALLMFMGILSSRAADSIFINTGTLNYPLTTNVPPTIDATNFFNSGSFTINFTTIPSNPSLFETRDTLNYTNLGAMTCDTGFLMDDDNFSENSRSMASSVANFGTITGGTSFFGVGTGNFLSSGSFLIGGLPFDGYVAWATNIVNPGSVSVGAGSSMNFIGETVDLSGGTLTFQNPNYNASGYGAIGETLWNPVDLAASNSVSGVFTTNASFNAFGLTNGFSLFASTPYFVTNAVGTNAVLVHSAFVQDFSGSNVTYSVYFNSANMGLGGGSVTIQWAATYTNYATQTVATNYLYLNDNYLLGSTTNVNLLGGYPDNFTLTESSVPLLTSLTAATTKFYTGFPSGTLTNLSSLGYIFLTSGGESTNQIANGSPTNLDGQLLISASKTLNLTNAQISGPNYISIQAPSQFSASSGSSFSAPYFDMNLGSTNGSMVISNLISPQIAAWNGAIEVWSTRWTMAATTTNGTSTSATNDYRVLLVESSLTPTSSSQVQTLALNATNNVILSDDLNILDSLSMNSLSLTITSNGISSGASSPVGGVNLENPSIDWSASFPDLLNLTNWGSIVIANAGVFESSSNYETIVPGTPVENAMATLASVVGATNLAPLDSVTAGYTTYVFVNKLTNSIGDQVSIGTSLGGSLSNLLDAINASTGSGTRFSSATTANPLVTGGLFETNGFTVTSRLSATAGNGLPVSVNSKAVEWVSGNVMSGGANATAGSTNVVTTSSWYDNFINQGTLTDQSTTIAAQNFVNGGFIFCANMDLMAGLASMQGGLISASSGVSITSGDLYATNDIITAGTSLTLMVTNVLTDGVASGPAVLISPNVWSVGGGSSFGINLLAPPVSGSLLGSTINATPPANKIVYNTWAASDMGVSPTGFINNTAIGQFNLSGLAGGVWYFQGTGSGNAIYIDSINLTGPSAVTDSQGNPVALKSAPNFNIYYAQAYSNGVSVAKALDGKNNGHLHWVSSYVGHFSSAAYTYNGQTYYVNAGLLASSPSSVFVAGQVNLTPSLTNVVPNQIKLQWNTPPGANNIVQYTTNLVSGPWLSLPKISQYYYGSGVSVSNSSASGFISPQSASGPVTNVWIFDSLTNSSERYYRVEVLQ